jgi:DNA replication protein DnaC
MPAALDALLALGQQLEHGKTLVRLLIAVDILDDRLGLAILRNHQGPGLCAQLAYERLSLIVTTNLPFESWTDVFGSERLTGALLDRLTHRVHILEANGPSYRLRESQHRLHPGGSQPDKKTPTDAEEPGPEDVSKK